MVRNMRKIYPFSLVVIWFSCVTPFSESAPEYLLNNTWEANEVESNKSDNVQYSDAYEGTFWQITDIHWDLQYSENGDPSKMCHKNSISDSHNGVYGNYRCDSPWPLVKSAIETMAEINNAPDFILWTGDNAPHTNDPQPDFSVIFNTISNITGEIRTTFQESVPILPVLGNHDAYPKDDFPVAGEEFYGLYLTKGGWSAILPEKAQEEFKKGGYYGYELPTGITVLVVNTNLYYAFNELGVNASDPCEQFAWLRKRLQMAQETNSKVIIAAHAPPGYFERFPAIPFFNATYNDAYVDLLNEFGMVIMAQIYGHEHTDSFRLFSTSKGDVQSVAFLAPSLTPWYPSPVPGGTAINPSLRLYYYNKSSLLDYTQYHLNLTLTDVSAAEELGSTKDITGLNSTSFKVTGLVRPKWELYYKARKTYGLKSLSAVDMASLYKQLVSDDALFQKYYARNSAGYDNGLCDPQCKKGQVCAIAYAKIKALRKCMGYNQTKYDVGMKASVEHSKEVPTFVMEDRLPGSVELLSKSSNSSHFIIVVIGLSMSLTVVLAVTLAVMLVLITIKRNQMLKTEKGLPFTDFPWCRQQNYKPLP
ncbi:acid sphingomyelinase-like phosphodiesterase 3b isoform X1 [Panulirus ornatus]|uniref:acid sphingomyelinase-like phosphodiesterase 3b isoform X1 n=1 Tax=Panulirus ornatus TaxID=150431 RepID=UPI003A8AEB71